MANKKATFENLGSVIGDILEDYAGEITQNIDEITEKVAKEGVKAVKSGAKAKFKGNKYWKGWAVEVERKRLWTTATIYNKKLPGLPHLLEHGHAQRGGGRVAGRAHIEPVEKTIIEKYEREIINELS